MWFFQVPLLFSVIFLQPIAPINQSFFLGNGDNVGMIQDFQELRLIPYVFVAVDAFQTAVMTVGFIFGVSNNQENKPNSLK